jgi:triacylglycerol lipase
MKIRCAFLTIIAGMAVMLFFSCASVKGRQAANDGDTVARIELNYPVVLVHGIALHDRTNIVEIWGRIPDTLTGRGVRVFYGNTDAWGNIETNALILKETIEKIISETGKEKVNIIAHSKGGLDSRYLIWKHDFGGKIASLTTMNTPHHGSEIADLLYDKVAVHTEMVLKVVDLYEKMSNDVNPDIYQANYELTTTYMKEFNEKVIMDDRVYCQSFYTTMNDASDDGWFYYTYLYIKKLGGDNDGMVSETSAKWGDNVTKIEGGISHMDILDMRKKEISGRNIPDIYIGIAKGLSEKGF